MRLTHMMASAALFALTAAAFPANAPAGDLLSGVSGKVDAKIGGGNIASVSGDVKAGGVSAKADAKVGGGVDAKAGATVGGVNAKVDAKIGSSTTATATVGTTTGKVLDSRVNASLGSATTGSTGGSSKAKLAGSIEAKAQTLSAKRLLNLCLSVGAKGCESASRSRQLALIKARVGKLSGQQLLSACVAVGGGCGTTLATTPDGGIGGGGNGGSGIGGGGGGAGPGTGGSGPVAGGNSNGTGGKPLSMASAGSDKEREMRVTCRRVMNQPARYETGLVQLCRKLLQ